MDDFVRVGIIAFWCIFSLSVHSAETQKQWPSAVKKAEQSIVQVMDDESLATGFVVRNDLGEAFVTINLHVVHDVISNPDSINQLQLIDRKGEKLEFQGLEVFAVFPDLVLIKLKNYQGPSLQLADFDEESQDGYVLGFPDGQFKQMKIWNIRFKGKIHLEGITYSRKIRGASGSPLLNEKGLVIGVMVEGTTYYSVSLSRSSFLKKLLEKTKDNSSRDLLESQLIKELTSLETSAQNGDSEAQSRLVSLYSEEGFLFFNPPKALKWMIKAAENGDAWSQINIAKFYIMSHLYEKGGELIKRAAEEGKDPQAMYYLSEFYRLGTNGFPTDPQKSLTWLIKAVENDHPAAMSRMAEMSLTGIGAPQNIELGLRLFRILSERGFSSLQEILSEQGIHLSESVFWSILPESDEESLRKSLKALDNVAACVPTLFKEPEDQSD